MHSLPHAFDPQAIENSGLRNNQQRELEKMLKFGTMYGATAAQINQSTPLKNMIQQAKTVTARIAKSTGVPPNLLVLPSDVAERLEQFEDMEGIAAKVQAAAKVMYVTANRREKANRPFVGSNLQEVIRQRPHRTRRKS